MDPHKTQPKIKEKKNQHNKLISQWIQNYQPVFQSSQMKTCIKLKRKILRRSGSIQSDTETSIIGSDVFFTSTVE